MWKIAPVLKEESFVPAAWHHNAASNVCVVFCVHEKKS